MIVTVPIRIESTPNLREHFHTRARRTREHRTAAYYALRAAKASHALPCVITITRIAPRSLDDDNAISGAKGVRDGIADWLDVKDNDPRVTWKYAQRRGPPKHYACEVEIA